MKVKLQDLFLGLAALTAQLRALLSSAFLQHRVSPESVWVKALVYHFVNHCNLGYIKAVVAMHGSDDASRCANDAHGSSAHFSRLQAEEPEARQDR